MIKVGFIVWVFLIFPGVVLGNHNTTGRVLWTNVYQDYVCDTADGYLWLAEACTFPVRKAIDYMLKFGDNSIDLYNSEDYSFNYVPLAQFDNENETIDTNLYDYNSIFPYSQDKICTDYMDLARTCLTHYFTNCSSSLNEDINSFMTEYKGQYCAGSTLHEYIQEEKGVLSAFVTGNTIRATCGGLTELYDDMVAQSICTEELTLDSPYAIDEHNITEYTATEPDSFYDVQENYARKLMTAFRCMEVEMRSLGCPTSQAQSLVIFMYNYLVPPGMGVHLEVVADIFGRAEETDSLTTGDESDQDRTTCGIYGNGFLVPAERLDINDQSMCSFRQRWTNLLTNKFVTVDALPVLESATDFGASYMSAVEIQLMDGSGSTLVQYSTSDGDLSTDVLIIDSKTEIVGSPSTQYISLEVLAADTLQITNPLGDVAVTITQYDGIYGIWIRMYDGDLERSYGSLVDGCEEIDTIDIVGVSLNGFVNDGLLPPIIPGRRRRRDVTQSCYDACSRSFRDASVEQYVCLTSCTANGGNTDAAVATTQQAEEVQEEYARSADNVLVEKNYSGAPALRHPTVMAVVLLAISILML